MLTAQDTCGHDPAKGPSGPFLLFRGTHNSVNVYSIMVVYPPSMLSETPTLSHLSTGCVRHLEHLDTAFEYAFWRFTIEVPVTCQTQHVQYQVDTLPPRTFVIPAKDQPWRWAFFSCNGYSSDIVLQRRAKYNGIQPLWRDILAEHAQNPLHLLMGGGDQLYFDPLFDVVPGLNQWAHITSHRKRKNAPCELEMERGVDWFYLNHYLHGFMDGAFATALATIPYCMSWDDHDIFDGWGSYPDYLHDSLVFQGIFQSALRFYLLFQHHTTPTLAYTSDGYMGEPGFHKVIQCGASFAVVLPDTRTERTLKRVVSPKSWDTLFDTLHVHLPRTVRHVLFVAPIPMTYPHSTAEGIVSAVGTTARAVSTAVRSIGKLFSEKSNLNSVMTSTQVFKTAVNRFGEPELLDDLCDHWNHSCHFQEKVDVMQRLQTLARMRSLRVTLISGDVHLAAVGIAFASSFRDNPLDNLPTDPCGMYQIVSSGIGNLPPPPLVASSLSRNLADMKLDNHTSERMLDIFKLAADGTSNPTPCFLRRRNWTLGELTHENNMRVWVCAEITKGNMDGQTMRYLVNVPDLRT